jgi:hypothetical protein
LFSSRIFTLLSNNISKSKLTYYSINVKFQNAFKTIEAIISEPPKNSTKLKSKEVTAAGFEPTAPLKYNTHYPKMRQGTTFGTLSFD